MYGKVKTSKDNIYSHVNDYDIFRYYISNFKTIGSLFRSEIRVDKNPTCCISKYGEKLLYVDFADIESKGLDVFAYIQKKYNCTFHKALDIISIDFNLPFILNYYETNTLNREPAPIYNLDITKLEPVSKSTIQVKTTEFTSIDKLYWYDRYDITVKDLKRFNVFSLKYYIQNGNLRSFSKHLYGYYFGFVDGLHMWKTYYPHGDKKNKWSTNCGDKIIQGYEQLPETGDTLIITKSLKDIIILHKLGIPAIAPQAENHLIPAELIQSLRTRFNHIYVLFDNDATGVKSAQKYNTTYHLPIFFIPLELEVKDSAEVVEWYDYSLLKDIINAGCNREVVK